ncbi:TonB-dependent receptor [Rapidithrix thailandica]|uniref:TonB-dependent receptor n=1 Tax=Rapidithrix thailandica TaxID=413964 RepID=A0AAW9SDC4_9BACT
MRTVILLFCLLMGGYAFGQNGTIRGTVVDDANGEPLIGATVAVDGTQRGASCDLDGRFSIENLPVGTYKLTVSFISYQTQIVNNVEVKAGEVALLNIRLAEESEVLDEIVVEAKALKDSEDALLTVQKKSPKVLDAISSEQFSRNGDRDIASAVKRVTGVSVEGGKYVYVRGLGDRYSKTVMNGADLPGLDPEKNSVQLDMIPSNLVDNVIIYKTFSPDLPGDFAGGLIDIETKDFPDAFTMQVSASLGYNTQSNLKSDFKTYDGGKLDGLGFDDGTRELPSQLNVSQDDFPNIYMDDEKLIEFTKAFDNTNFDFKNGNSFLDHKLSLSLGNQSTLFGKQFGWIAAINYARSWDQYTKGFTGRYQKPSGNSQELLPTSLLEDNKSTEDVTWGGMLSGTLKLSDNHKIKANLLHNQAGTKNVRYQEGPYERTTFDNKNIFRARSLWWKERSISTGQLIGEHLFSGLGNLKVDWISSMTLSKQDEPDLRFFTDTYEIQDDGSRKYAVTVTPFNPPSRYYRNMEEINFDNKIHFTLPVKILSEVESKIKFGGAYTFKDREFRESRYEYARAGNKPEHNGNPSDYLSEDHLGKDAEGNWMIYLDNASEDPNNYDADQTVTAGYLMVETPLTNNQKLKTTFGARLEMTNIDLITFNDIQGSIETQDILPSISFTYELIKDMNLRLAYNKTLARPTFREFAPLATFDFVGDFVQLGNPNLERTLIDNFDLRWEYYPRRGEYFSVSPFYKRFTNPIENTINVNATNLEYQYRNVGEATVYGIELEARKNLDFIAEGLKNFKLGANVTLVKSEVELTEAELNTIRNRFNPDQEKTRQLYMQSPYIVNAFLQYNNFDKGWDVNLTYNVFGERLYLVSTELPFVYEKPRPDLGVSVAKTLNKKWKVTLRARNLLNPDYLQEMELGGTDYTFQKYTKGRSFSVGIKYQIN